MRFLVALRKDEESDWGAEVVGAPVFSVGSTSEEALKSGEYDDAILRILEVEV